MESGLYWNVEYLTYGSLIQSSVQASAVSLMVFQ